MTSPQLPETGATGDPLVPFSQLALFVRQVIHDVRNGLNSMDLQAAYLAELAAATPELAEESRRLRTYIKTSTRQLEALSSNFWSSSARLIDYPANILIEDFRDRLLKEYPEAAPRVRWTAEVGEHPVSVDINMFFGALTRIFDNAFVFAEPEGEIKARAFVEDGNLVLELTETKASVASDPAHWGEEPFRSTRRGGYGLGLFRARRLLALHRAELKIAHDPKAARLTSRVTLPLGPTA